MLCYSNMDKSAYFPSRSAVGKQLAQKLAPHRYYNSAVLALSPGAAMVAVEIARRTYSPIGLLLTKDIVLPDHVTTFGVISSDGDFTYQLGMSKPQIEEFEMEYRNAINHNKMMAMHDLNVVGHRVMLDPHFCTQRRVIIVNDMAKSATDFKAGMDFLHAIATEKTILVSAVAMNEALYRMQELGDEVLVEHSTDKDFPPEHYFDDNSIPETEEILKLMTTTLVQDNV